MENGFLDNLPDLGISEPERRRQPPKPPKPADVVVYVKLRCPKCGSFNIPVYNSDNLPIRYHKCSDCGHNFKSVEEK